MFCVYCTDYLWQIRQREYCLSCYKPLILSQEEDKSKEKTFESLVYLKMPDEEKEEETESEDDEVKVSIEWSLVTNYTNERRRKKKKKLNTAREDDQASEETSRRIGVVKVETKL